VPERALHKQPRGSLGQQVMS